MTQNLRWQMRKASHSLILVTVFVNNPPERINYGPKYPVLKE